MPVAVPATLAGPGYPAGIPIVPEDELAELVRSYRLDEIVLAYSDLAHEDVMHKERALKTGAAWPASVARVASSELRRENR